MNRRLKKGLTWFALSLVCATVMVAFVGLDQAQTLAQQLTFLASATAALASATLFFILTHGEEQ